MSRQQALGLSFIRWYKITSKLVQLDYNQPQQRFAIEIDELHNTYILNRMVAIFATQRFKRLSGTFTSLQTSQSCQKRAKMKKKLSMIFITTKAFHEQLYR